MLLKIALKCPQFKIDHIIDNIEDIIELVGKDTPISKQILEHCLHETIHSRKIKELNWNKPKIKVDAFKHDTTFVDSKLVSSMICDKDKKHIEIRKLVDIKVISLRWMFQDGKRFCDLVSEFKGLERPSWFGHELLEAFFKTHW